jgi:iron complex outermembrane receptor protein
MHHHKTSRLVAAAVAAIVAAAPVSAAENDVLEEVVVTAEKRSSTVQDTPISIAAFSGAELESAGITTTDGLSNLTPGLVVQKEVIGKVVIRGVGTENFSVGSDPGVAIHHDGVYVARSSVSIFDFFDTERVEVLRGPQGTLYGRNATGGVINIISRKPEKDFGGYAKLDVGNYSKVRVEGALNAPFSDAVSGRLSVLWAQRDGYSENKFATAKARDNDQLDNQDLWAVRGQLAFEPSDTFSGLLQVDVARDDSNPTAFKYFTHAAGDPNMYWTVPSDKRLPSLREVSQGYEQNIVGSTRRVPSIGRAHTDAANLKLTWDLGDLQLMSQTAYRKTIFSWLNDGDGTDVFFVTYFQDDDSKQLTQEFQLANTGDGALKWILGAFYLKEDSKTFSGLAFNGLAAALGFPAGSIEGILIDGKSNTKSYSAYAQGTYSLTDATRITAGVRYTKDEKDGDMYYLLSNLVFTPQFVGYPAGKTWADVLQDNWSAVTPKFGIDHDFTDDIMGYVSATRGFKSGGFNLIGRQAPYDPEYLWSYEAGLKTKLADGRVIANFGVFQYNYKDMQVGKITNASDVLTNAGKATLRGFEAELRAALGGGFELNAGAAFLDAQYDEFLTEDPAVTPLPAGGSASTSLGSYAGGCERRVGPFTTGSQAVSLAGCDLRRAPPFAGNVGLGWTTALNGGELSLRGDYAYKGKQYFTQFNRNAVAQDGYGLLSLRAGWRSSDDKYGLTAYVDNVADEDYYSTVLESGIAPAGGLVPQSVMGAPRTFGVSFRVGF